MQPFHLLGAVAALAVTGFFLTSGTHPAAHAAPEAAMPSPPPPTIANGHYVLVVEGDRNGLTITHASLKEAPWAGVPKGLATHWDLAIHGDRGELLAEIPLDLSHFALGAEDLGSVHVQGCVVKNSQIAMLVNVPAFAAATSYTFRRPGDDGGRVVLGTVPGETVRTLAGGGR
jgi:hypothetical protein